MRRTVRELVVMLALALGGVALSLLAGCGGSSTPSAHERRSASAPDRSAEAAARALPGPLRRPPTDASQRLDQGGDTVGEGQAYGMLIGGGDRRLAALRHDLGLDEGQPPAS